VSRIRAADRGHSRWIGDASTTARAHLRSFERSLVALKRSDREVMEFRVAVEEVPVVVEAEREVVRLLHRAHEHVGTIGELPVQGGRPAFAAPTTMKSGRVTMRPDRIRRSPPGSRP
jgi:hypothetical protein